MKKYKMMVVVLCVMICALAYKTFDTEMKYNELKKTHIMIQPYSFHVVMISELTMKHNGFFSGSVLNMNDSTNSKIDTFNFVSTETDMFGNQKYKKVNKQEFEERYSKLIN